MGRTSTKPGFLIVDVEATCWETPRETQSEIIEIGAVAVDWTGSALDEFQTFVRPILNPELSDFCMDLTHITQADVDGAPPLPEALARFKPWAKPLGPMTFTSWGDYDRKQLVRDCALHRVPYPLPGRHINLKKAFARIHHRKPMGMSRALKLVGIELQGTHHRGIDDARNIARILAHILQAKQRDVLREVATYWE